MPYLEAAKGYPERIARMQDVKAGRLACDEYRHPDYDVPVTLEFRTTNGEPDPAAVIPRLDFVIGTGGFLAGQLAEEQADQFLILWQKLSEDKGAN